MKKTAKKDIACVISGGKDGLFAYYQIREKNLYNIKVLLNLYTNEDEVSFHQYHKKLVGLQAKAIGIKLIQREIIEQHKDQALFEVQLQQIIQELKGLGIVGISFGYINSGDYQDRLLHRICKENKMKLLLPNYGKKSVQVLSDIIQTGIIPMVTSVDPEKLSDKWLGRRLDKVFLSEISKMKGIDPCGDAGEYHTFVLDAPFFLKSFKLNEKKVEIFETKTVLAGMVSRQRNFSLNKVRLVIKDKNI
jgi:diphthine-ammonia ligase